MNVRVTVNTTFAEGPLRVNIGVSLVVRIAGIPINYSLVGTHVPCILWDIY